MNTFVGGGFDPDKERREKEIRGPAAGSNIFSAAARDDFL